MHEAQMHEYTSFLTLTYDEEHLPKDNTVVLEHWQLFAKRLRKRYGPFRFFHCGEYGDKSGRAHYHAAIFGLDFHSDRVNHKRTQAGHQLYTSLKLDTIWTHGAVWIGDLTFESAAYIARYILKKQTGEAGTRFYHDIDYSTGEVLAERKPPYITMSRNPGLGSTWIRKYMDDVYPRDEVIMRGKRMRPPKYYDREYEKIDPDGWRQVRVRREVSGDSHADDNTYDRLAVRETCKNSQIQTLTRDI